MFDMMCEFEMECVSYLKEAEDVGDHDGDDAEGGSDDARDRLVWHVHRGFARLALVLRHVLQHQKPDT
jgi:hypothetical protein